MQFQIEKNRSLQVVTYIEDTLLSWIPVIFYYRNLKG